MCRSISARARNCQVPAALAGALLLLLPCVAQARANAEPQKVRAEQYTIEVRFEPEKGFLHAKAAVGLRIAPNTKTIEFELNSHLNILEVTDAQGSKLEFRRSGLIGSPKLLVWLAQTAATEQEITLTFVYEGVIPRGALDYISKEGILLRDESRWYPAVDLSAFTQNEVTVWLPSGWEARTTGIPEDPRAEGTTQSQRWITDGKESSRSLIAYPKEKSFTVLLDAAEETITASGETARLIRGGADTLTVFSKLLGTYRYTGFHILPAFPGQRGALGYSAPGFMVVSEDVIKYHDYPGWSPEFMPHEIAHQWFPIEVTLTREEDGWLAESLAEYLAWRYLREKEPEQARRMVQRAMRDALLPDPLPPLALGLKLFREPWQVTRATLYQRGLLVWRTLETVIDRERVDRALREYYKRYAGRSASIADFRKICEEISGRDLGWFFEYFINGTQIPEISLRRIPSPAPNVLQGEIVVKNAPPEFQVRVELRVQTAKGAVDYSVATRGKVTPFSVNLPAAATNVTLEPDMRLLRWTEAALRNREQKKLLAQLGELESAGEFNKALETSRRAMAVDTEDVAFNQQLIHFVMGRMLFRAGNLADAKNEFAAVQERTSLDAMDTDFYRAWARVYRARIASRLGQAAAAQQEITAGLASKSPAMETKIAWPESAGREFSAREAQRSLSQSLKKSSGEKRP